MIKRRPVFSKAFMGKKEGLTGTAEKPVLVLPSLTRDLGTAVGANCRKLHLTAPFVLYPLVALTLTPSHMLCIASPLPKSFNL